TLAHVDAEPRTGARRARPLWHRTRAGGDRAHAARRPAEPNRRGAEEHEVEGSCSRRRAGQVVRRAGGGRLMPLFKRRPGEESLTLYYASDIHGSDLLWRKFLGANKFYGADAAIMGGDLLGKAVVPIERRDDERYRLT